MHTSEIRSKGMNFALLFKINFHPDTKAASGKKKNKKNKTACEEQQDDAYSIFNRKQAKPAYCLLGAGEVEKLFWLCALNKMRGEKLSFAVIKPPRFLKKSKL